MISLLVTKFSGARLLGVFTRLFHKKIGKIIKKHEVTFINIFYAVGLLKKTNAIKEIAESEAFRYFLYTIIKISTIDRV